MKNLIVTILVLSSCIVSAQNINFAENDIYLNEELEIDCETEEIEVNETEEIEVNETDPPLYTIRNCTGEWLFINFYVCYKDVFGNWISTGDFAMVGPFQQIQDRFAGFTSNCPANANWTQASLVTQNGSTSYKITAEMDAEGKLPSGKVKAGSKIIGTYDNVYNWAQENPQIKNNGPVVYNMLAPNEPNLYIAGPNCTCYTN